MLGWISDVIKLMREIVLNVQTTGLDPKEDRVAGIDAVELYNHIPTGQTYHHYIDPERQISDEAFDVNGLDDAFLAEELKFQNIAQGFLDFIDVSPLVSHNAPFDLNFLNAEFKRIGMAPLLATRAIDTLQMARKKFPDATVTLEALCRRYNINMPGSAFSRTLFDAEALSQIYYHLGDFKKPSRALSGQASLILRNAAAVSLSVHDTAANLRVAIDAHLNETGANQLDDDLAIFEHLAVYFAQLADELHGEASREALEARIGELERIVRELVDVSGTPQTASIREKFVASFIETCGSSAAVALISGGTLVLGRYAPTAVEALMNFVIKP